MDSCNIQFLSLEPDFLPRPVPANHAPPAWLKQMPTLAPDESGQNLQTIKQCLPFLDAMTSGYLIPLVGDVECETDADGKLSIHTPDFQAGFERHSPAQLAESPWMHVPVIKFQNPWVIVTPPGYSCLFIQPLNREPIPFKVFSGVVETDSLYREVNFPAACMMKPNSRCTLTRGTPIMQVIPFRRDTWTSTIGMADAKRLEEIREQIAGATDVYRDWFHERKSFR